MQCKHKLLITSLMLASTSAAATSLEKPNFYGDMLGQLRWEDGQDYQSEIHRATVGLKGKHKTDVVTAIYTLEGEYSEDLTATTVEDQDFDTRISEANIVLVSKGYGSIFFGNGTTGTYKNLYNKVDIFDSNNMHVSSNADLFRQGRYGKNQFAYATPIWNNLQFKGALITPKQNGNDVDVIGMRLLYNTKDFSLVLNRAQTDDSMVPTDKDYVRWALASSYKMDNFFIGALAEMNVDDPQGDSMVYGVSGKYTMDKVTFKLGAQHKAFDEETSVRQDHSLYLASASYAFSEHLSTFVEIAEYVDVESAENRNDNINVGLQVKF